MWWLVLSSFWTTQILSVSATRLLCFLTIHVFTGAALFISFENFPFAFIYNLAVRSMDLALGHVWAIVMPSSLREIISSFRFEARDVWLFLSLEHLQASLGLVPGLISIVLCFHEEGGPREKRWGNKWWTEHTHIKFAILNRCGLWHSQIITIVTSMITDHHNKYNKNKIIIFCNSYQNVTDTKWGYVVRNMLPIDLPNSGLPQTFNL